MKHLQRGSFCFELQSTIGSQVLACLFSPTRYHIAHKDIPSIDANGLPTTVKGIKLEMFVFDAFMMSQRCRVLVVSELMPQQRVSFVR